MNTILAQFEDGDYKVNAVLTKNENGYLVEMIHEKSGELRFHIIDNISHGGLSYQLVEKDLPITYEMLEQLEYFINEDLSNSAQRFE